MTRRWPVLPTVIVALAVATMIALGFWQLLDRLPRKEAFLARLAANPTRPVIAFPATADETLLFRRATATCTNAGPVRLAGAGSFGYRAIVECGGAPALILQLGTTRDPKARVVWSGGAVSGRIGNAPDGRSLIGSLLNPAPPRPMLILDPPAAGLAPNQAPTIDSIPNSHLAYAGQWFFFAGVASVIYILAVRRRGR